MDDAREQVAPQVVDPQRMRRVGRIQHHVVHGVRVVGGDEGREHRRDGEDGEEYGAGERTVVAQDPPERTRPAPRRIGGVAARLVIDADARIDGRVEHVDQQIDEHEDEGDGEDGPLHHRVVTIRIPSMKDAAETLDREDRLPPPPQPP